ncbi:YdcF family protein [Sphingomonas sp. LaA6.9]|uniref:YdcF family protein n=1 Tax=Sphingomonas sp. LaA6.9 TaxID=2919914 RepID=UPI001F4F7206|nr:YdcF family protein [Sphingomonas sp. LaA6.9]MCJ8155906.1 YdcF family protein [Sphingomonas sp. LaA6.9]
MMIRMERIATPLAVAIALSLSTAPAFAGAARDTAAEALSQRLFPLLDRLSGDTSELNTLKTQPDAARVLGDRQARRAACGQDLGCTAMAMMWSDAEAATLAAAIEPLARGAAPDDGAVAGFTREVQGINAIVSSYALGAVPRYAQIDGAGMLDPQEAKARLQGALALAQTPRAGSAQALDPSIEFALALLDTHDRTDATGFEPLTGGRNAPAFERARRIDWKRWRYTAMIVTGVGPETPDMPLSPMGKYHLRLAANRFAAGDIPFIIVTGGRAHPRATRFAEAEEMRRALIERYGVPAHAIVIEPYARHTTTNLRNASRLLMMMGAPLDRDALIVCNPTQSAYIESTVFTQRNEAELGYQPGQAGARLSPTELVFRPSARSARVDPRDPLDP